jgi:hypothetical protein
MTKRTIRDREKYEDLLGSLFMASMHQASRGKLATCLVHWQALRASILAMVVQL